MANDSAVQPAESFVFISTKPVSSSSFTTFSRLLRAAHNSGVPCTIESFVSKSTLPVFSSNHTTLSCPHSAANESGVRPYKSLCPHQPCQYLEAAVSPSHILALQQMRVMFGHKNLLRSHQPCQYLEAAVSPFHAHAAQLLIVACGHV